MGKKFTECPKCGGEDLQYCDVDYCDEGLREGIECACGYEWFQIYRFVYSEDMDGVEIK